MINRLIELSLRNRFIVSALFIALAGWGWWAVKATPIDAIAFPAAHVPTRCIATRRVPFVFRGSLSV